MLQVRIAITEYLRDGNPISLDALPQLGDRHGSLRLEVVVGPDQYRRTAISKRFENLNQLLQFRLTVAMVVAFVSTCGSAPPRKVSTMEPEIGDGARIDHSELGQGSDRREIDIHEADPLFLEAAEDAFAIEVPMAKLCEESVGRHDPLESVTQREDLLKRLLVS